MEDPYRSPTQAIELPAGPAFRWKRVLVWAASIYAAAMVVGFLSGLTMGFWEIYGSTMDAAIENARLVRRIAYGVVGAILYWRLAAPVRQRLLHVAAAFLIVQLIDVAVSLFVFRIPATELIDPSSLGRSLLAAVVGLALASAGSRTSFRPGLRST
jgi:FtsH-binding integral membrane protein